MMMKKMLGGTAVALALGLCVSMTWACPGENASAKGGCSKSATTVALKASDGRSEGTPVAKEGCGPDCDMPCCAKKSAESVKSSAKAKLTAKKKGGCNKSGCGKKGAKTASGTPPCHAMGAKTAASDSDCPIGKKVKAILASLPAMRYRVGDEIVGCSKSASAMAEKTGSTLQYVVGEESFADKGAAVAKLTALLEKEASSMQQVQFVAGGKCHQCPMTAKSVAKETKTKLAYRVGGVDFATRKEADAALEKVQEAVKLVKMEYKVGDKKYGCSKTAGAKCKETGAKMTYVIGDEETCCEKTAKMKLAEMKVRTIVEAAAQTLSL